MGGAGAGTLLGAMSEPRPPTPREQIDFLRSVQRILDEGSFVATYKFALLHAIADLCVLEGDDSGGALELGTRDIAERFVRLYWPQVVPFASRSDARTLRQNTGRQAAIVREVREAHEQYQGSLAALERDRETWEALIASARRTVEKMPLWRLQTVGSESSSVRNGEARIAAASGTSMPACRHLSVRAA